MGKFALVFLFVLLGGCYPRFEHPLTPVTTSSYDQCLAGAWGLDSIGDEQEEGMFFHFGKAQGGEFELVTVSYSRSGSMEVKEITGHSSVTSAGSFLNLREIMDGKELYIYFWYEPSNSQLIIRPLDVERISDSLETGVLQGDVEKDYVTSKPAEIISYFEQMGESLFMQDKMIFSRVTESRC
ncbi:MAG: hypothetical protein JKY46_03515 [Robiginitomaculum sp.]|nr:hypothetical protein [Robiginitomaculum sp.]